MISARHHLAQKTTIKDRALLMGAAYIQDRSLLHGYVQDLLQQPRAAKHESVVAPAAETAAVAAPAQAEPPVAEAVIAETPAVEAPVAETVSAEAQVEVAAVVEAPMVEAHAESVVSETPIAEVPAVETSAVETLVAEVPEIEAPVVETPALESPVAEIPVEATPVAETPAAEAPAVTAPTPVETPPVAQPPRSINWFLNMRVKLRAQKYASLPQRIKASAVNFEASKASVVAAPVVAEAPVQQPVAEPPVQQPANEAPAQAVSAPQSSPAAQQPAVTPEEGYAIGAFSSFSFVEADDEGADDHEENLVMLRESVELQAPVLPDDNGEIIFEEENRIVEIVVSPELLAKYFNGHLPVAQHHESAPVAEDRVTLEFLPQGLSTPEPEPKAETRSPVHPVKRATPSAQELIDRFIEQEPSIKRNAIQDIPPGDLARESSQERDDMVTETLAKIYAKQGNRGKAIKIYQKLGLLFPEKRDYFAARIAELK